MSDPNSPDVRLEVDDTLYGGWTSIAITRGLEQLAGTFDLSVTERWPGQDAPRPIKPGAACRVLVDGEPVITGYVDDVSLSYNATDHTVTVSGRDKTGDLVDCCPPSTQLKGATFAAIAANLAAPFGIGVVDRAGTGPVPRFKTNPGDTIFEILEQLARAKGVLLTTDGRGRLVITRAGGDAAPAGLELGKNVREGKLTFSMRDRFSAITVLGQSSATSSWNGAAASQQKTVVTDTGVPRHRPLALVAEQEHQGAHERAQWEVNVRYGKGNTAAYTVYGWKAGGKLWTPGARVSIRDAFAGLDVSWVLASVRWTLDDQGYRSELTLHPAEAFSPEPISPKKSAGKSGAVWPGAKTAGAV